MGVTRAAGRPTATAVGDGDGYSYDGQEDDRSRSNRSRSGGIDYQASPEALAMKKLINHPAAVVEEMIEGLVAVFPGLRRLAGETVMVRAEIPD